MKYKKHEHGRGTRSFDRHKAAGRDVGNRKGKAWGLFDPSKRYANPFEPHSRAVQRTHALSGKHIRAVEEPVRPPHGKTN